MPERDEIHASRRSLAGAAALVAYGLFYVSWHVLGWVPGSSTDYGEILLLPIEAVGVITCWRASRRSAGFPALQRFWRLIAAAIASAFVADVVQSIYIIGFAPSPYPSLADPLYLLFYPLLLIALLHVPTPAATPGQRLRMLLDCATLVLGGAMAVWAFLLSPALSDGGSFLLMSASIAYPVADIVLLTALAVIVMRRGPKVLSLPLSLIGAAMLASIIGDVLFGYGVLNGNDRLTTGIDTLYMVSLSLFLVAGITQRAVEPGDSDALVAGHGAPTAPRATWLPYIGGFASMIIVVSSPSPALVAAAVLLGMLVGSRQYLAQRELYSLQRRTHTIINSVAEGIITVSPEGEVLTANPPAEQIFGAESGDLAGTRIEALLDTEWPDVAPHFLRSAREARDGEAAEVQLLRGRRLDGSSFPMEVKLTAVDLGGEQIFVGVGQDISERQASEAALRGSEKRFRGIFDTAQLGITVSAIDPVGGERRIIDVNPAFEEISGYSAEELRGGDFSSVVHPDELDEMADIGAQMVAGASVVNKEMRMVRKGGGAYLATVTVSAVQDDETDLFLTIGMVEDVTKQRQAERIKEEFVSVVGHELRTPLTSIRGSLGLLEGGVMGDLPPDAMDMVATAVTNTDRLVRLVGDILDIERIDAGKTDLTLGAVDALEIIDEAISVVDALPDGAGIRLRSDVREDLLVEADSDRIVQTLVNLLGNAIKFSNPGGAVTVSAERDGAGALFSVHDTGRGIPPEQLETIFERFGQVDVSDAREKGGTGLGLSIARGIVEHHGGSIWAESPPGDGTTIRFTLALAHDGLVDQVEIETVA